MAFLSPKFPLHFLGNAGYESNRTIREVVKQNLKNLLLTSPGERVMIPDFGVGLRRYLFEQNTNDVFPQIRSKVTEQIKKYMPFIEVQEIEPIYEESDLFISVKFYIVPINTIDILRVRI